MFEESRAHKRKIEEAEAELKEYQKDIPTAVVCQKEQLQRQNQYMFSAMGSQLQIEGELREALQQVKDLESQIELMKRKLQASPEV